MSTRTKTDTHSCPKCGSGNVQRFRGRGLGIVVRLAGFGCYRCSSCGCRFNRFRGWSTIHTRLFLGALMLVGFVVVVWFLLSRIGGVPPLPTE